MTPSIALIEALSDKEIFANFCPEYGGRLDIRVDEQGRYCVSNMRGCTGCGRSPKMALAAWMKKCA